MDLIPHDVSWGLHGTAAHRKLARLIEAACGRCPVDESLGFWSCCPDLGREDGRPHDWTEVALGRTGHTQVIRTVRRGDEPGRGGQESQTRSLLSSLCVVLCSRAARGDYRCLLVVGANAY